MISPLAMKFTETWDRLLVDQSDQVAETLQTLLETRQSVPTSHVTALINLIVATSSSVKNPAVPRNSFLLLARWARQLHLQYSNDNNNTIVCTLIQQAVGAAINIISTNTTMTDSVTAAAVVFLSSATVLLNNSNTHGQNGSMPSAQVAAEAVVTTLRNTTLTTATATNNYYYTTTATAGGGLLILHDAITAIASLLTASLNIPDACIQAVDALFTLLDRVVSSICMSTHNTVDVLSALQPMLRTTTTATLANNTNSIGFIGRLIDLLSSYINQLKLQQQQQQRQHDAVLIQTAAAVFSLAGVLEGILRSSSNSNSNSNHVASHHAARAEESLLHAIQYSCTLLEQHQQQHLQQDVNVFNACAVLQFSSGLASSQLFAAVRRPLPCPETLLCQSLALLEGALTLQPFLQALQQQQHTSIITTTLPLHAAMQKINEALHTYTQQQSMFKQVPILTRTFTEHCYALLPHHNDLVQPVLQHITACAQRIHTSYRQYILHTPPNIVSNIDAVALRAVLDRAFSSCIDILHVIDSIIHHSSSTINRNGANPALLLHNSSHRSGAAAHNGNNNKNMLVGTLAVAVLSVAGDLQFCRSPSPKYTDLLKAAMAALPSDGQCGVKLIELMPCYSDIVVPADMMVFGGGRKFVWEIDVLSAAKLQLLFSALAPGISAIPQECIQPMLLERAVPLAFLYMLHAHRPTSIAAQEVIKATISTVPTDTSQQLAPYFIASCLEGYPATIDAQQLSQALDHVVRVLPPTSGVSLICLEDVLNCCVGVYEKRTLTTSTASATGGAGSEEGDKLFTAAAMQIMTVPYPLLGQTMALFEQYIVGKLSRIGVRSKVLSVILAVVSNSDDCVRKPELAVWYQRMCSM